MRRSLSGMLLPLLLAVVGVALIIVGQLDLDRPPASSLPPIPDPTDSPVAIATPSASQTGKESQGETQKPTPSPSPPPKDWVATQIVINSVGINVPVHKCTNVACDSFPAEDSAFILRESSQPGRGTNSYIFAHATQILFKPLWNVQLGARVNVRMSDGAVLRYVVTEVHPNVACPDDSPPNPQLNPRHADLPLVLQLATDCSAGVAWTQPADHERLTLQTSQGYNRNWGELVIVADPA